MTNSNHTPGPWSIEEPIDGILSIVAGGPEAYNWDHICQVGIEALDENNTISAVANARLISTAPELYEAPKEACDLIKDLVHYANNNGGEYPFTEFAEGRAALAKAVKS